MEMFKQKLKFGVFKAPDYTQPKEKYEVEFFDRRTGERRVEVRERHPFREFQRGDVVYHERDLAAAEPNRWEGLAERARTRVQVPVEAPVGMPPDDEFSKDPDLGTRSPLDEANEEELEQMTLKELQEFAKDQGVLLGGAKVKADVIRAILQRNAAGVGSGFKNADDGD